MFSEICCQCFLDCSGFQMRLHQSTSPCSNRQIMKNKTTKVSTYSFEATESHSLDKMFSSCRKPKNKSLEKPFTVWLRRILEYTTVYHISNHLSGCWPNGNLMFSSIGKLKNKRGLWGLSIAQSHSQGFEPFHDPWPVSRKSPKLFGPTRLFY